MRRSPRQATTAPSKSQPRRLQWSTHDRRKPIARALGGLTDAAPVEHDDHSGLAARRIMVGLTGGLVAAAIAVVDGSSWSVAALFASDTAAAVFVIWVWLSVISRDATTTARIA